MVQFTGEEMAGPVVHFSIYLDGPFLFFDCTLVDTLHEQPQIKLDSLTYYLSLFLELTSKSTYVLLSEKVMVLFTGEKNGWYYQS